ncbi:MAG TPA: hypothetical protein VKZ68_09945 [Ohtaekwangia sp.]|nr:hypothetical protein [Ohtaekwangia sp.]
MSLGADILLRLTRRYEANSTVDFKFRGKDVTVKTDAQGNPVIAFVGKRGNDGKIKGQRYARTLKADDKGRVFKDHWDLKGTA